MRIGVTLPLADGDTADGHVPTFEETAAFARHAEAAGLDSIWIFDHLLFRVAGEPEEGVREGWTTLAALAPLVPRVELGSLVMCSSFRNPALMAKMAATLDDLSGGRVILGLGSGWHDPEYEAFGYPTDHKVGRFAEDLEITARLLRGERVTCHGSWRDLDDAVLLPPPAPPRRRPATSRSSSPRRASGCSASPRRGPRPGIRPGSAASTTGSGRGSRAWRRAAMRWAGIRRRSAARSGSVSTSPAAAPTTPSASTPTRPAWPTFLTSSRGSASTTPSSGRSRSRATPSTASPRREESIWPGRREAVGPRTGPGSLGYDAPVKIHEADAKALLVAQGLPVPPWEVARTPTQARAAAVKFLADPANATGKVVIKAQVLVGARGKAGGVKLAASADEAEDVAAQILALEIKGLPVRRVLVGPAAEIVKEYYLSVLLDRSTKRLMFIGSAEGGIEIEQVAKDNPGAIVYEHVDPLLGLPDYAAPPPPPPGEPTPPRGPGGHGAQGTPVERLVCLDAKITLDDSALARHPGHEA